MDRLAQEKHSQWKDFLTVLMTLIKESFLDLWKKSLGSSSKSPMTK